MYCKPSKNGTGLKLEYNVNNPDDVKLAKAFAKDWKKRGETHHKLIPIYEKAA